ncbi:MAG: DUF3850 domain-containing protein [Clostridia bacterium]|nr:DUF3850 domain-containing protein [Clostridia bacterium]
MIHQLKTIPKYFDDVISGKKSFEVRKNDRQFRENDLLALNEYDPDTNTYTGRSCVVYVDYILSAPEYVKDGYVILSIKPCTVMKCQSPIIIGSSSVAYDCPLATEKYLNATQKASEEA